ncbi:hypothetical protein [Solirubrobacter deserti]|uniref:hypothetical protein n=1 Tax=Solirubrobacter deserti TaxID=2282478 RepID=UPI0022CD607E|nr:hypothetical protein [Solirubrobacter deserti]
MRRLWSWQPWELPPWGRAVLVVAAVLTAGALAYADLPSWAVGLVSGITIVIVGALLEAWQRSRREDAGPPVP